MNPGTSDPTPPAFPRDVVVLIDGENIGGTHHLPHIVKVAKRYGRIIQCRYYHNLTITQASDIQARAEALPLEIIPVQTRFDGTTIKNSVDFRMLIDAVDLFHRIPSIRTYVICTNDAAFGHLFRFLRAQGAYVVCLCKRAQATMALINQADKIEYYDGATFDPHRWRLEVPTTTSAYLDQSIQWLRELLQASPDGCLKFSVVAETMRNRYGFDYHRFGPRFGSFIALAARAGAVRVVEDGPVPWVALPVRAPGPDPEPAEAPAVPPVPVATAPPQAAAPAAPGASEGAAPWAMPDDRLQPLIRLIAGCEDQLQQPVEIISLRRQASRLFQELDQAAPHPATVMSLLRTRLVRADILLAVEHTRLQADGPALLTKLYKLNRNDPRVIAALADGALAPCPDIELKPALGIANPAQAVAETIEPLPHPPAAVTRSGRT